MSLLLLLLVALSLAYLLSEICKHIYVPRVVGQILGGILIGAFAKGYFTQDALSSFSSLADVGIVLLFFFTGFEVNLQEFRRHFKNSILISVFNTTIPFVLGVLLSYSLGFGPATSVVIGICLAVSSTAISIDFLEEFKLLKSKVGNIIVTTGTVDDFLELIFISVVVTYLQVSIGGGSLESLGIGMLAFIGIAVILRFLVLPFVLDVIQKEHSHAGLFMIALILTLLMASFADYLGLGTLIGALIAGVIVRHSLLKQPTRKPWESHEISQTMHAVSFGFLVPIFFVWVGLNTDLASILSNPILTIGLTLIAIVGTVVGTALAIRYEKGSWEEGMLVGWGVTAKGDVELVVASLALKNNLITQEIFSALIIMAFATTLIAPIVFRRMIKQKAALKSAMK
ncbi:MAG TPA: cation:proton antiporter [Candidatus Norongarragalinales archaeon]|nr:cation:proton antiporter [Candidatus Norongarragalinales archaeon]